MSKHAYLIMAHNDFYIFNKLIRLLDSPDNDLYIHIDIKVTDFNFEEVKNIIKYSQVYFVTRVDCRWGDYSLVECKLRLLKEATKNKYTYYHLLSGVDLPLKNQHEIYTFFEQYKGKEFIHFADKKFVNKNMNRVEKLHLFNKYYSVKNKIIRKVIVALNLVVLYVQNILGIKKEFKYEIQMGSQWFSITHELANFVISKEKWIRDEFRYSHCPDEIFLQSVVYNSEFRNNIFSLESDYEACQRKVDWMRGNPYTFKDDDLDELINSKFLFARKFSSKDKRVIDGIFDMLYTNCTKNSH